MLKRFIPLWHLVLQVRDDFLHGHRFVLQWRHLQKAPSTMPREAFLIAVV